jgi:hypothetical protein
LSETEFLSGTMPGWQLSAEEVRDLEPPAEALQDPAAVAVYGYLTYMWARCARPLSLWEAWKLERLTAAPETCFDRQKLTDAEWEELNAIMARDAAAAETEARTVAAAYQAEADAPRPPVPVLLDYFADLLDAGDPRVVPTDAEGRQPALMISDDGVPLSPALAPKVREEARAAARALAADPDAVCDDLTEDGAEMLWAMMRADRLDALAATTIAELRREAWEPRRGDVARRVELCQKGLQTAEERAAERAAYGLEFTPSLSESLAEAEGIPPEVIRAASAYLLAVGGEHIAHEHVAAHDPPVTASARWTLANDHVRTAQDQVWQGLTQRLLDAERRAATAEQEAARLRESLNDERQRKRRLPLRQGTAYLSAVLTREDHVAKARRRVAERLSEEETALRKLFTYQPLGYAERLAIVGLAAFAREQGVLEAHPTALSARPLADQPAGRIRMAFPGYSELARVVGYEPGPDGKIPKATRTTLERALKSLCTIPRYIAEPVLVPVRNRAGKVVEWTKDTRVTQALWVEASTTVLAKNLMLDLHPVAVASMLASWVSVDNLAARYERARREIGRPRMLDEWAIADDYLRWLAGVKAQGQRKQGAGEVGEVKGGERSVTAEVSQATFRHAVGLRSVVRDRGERIAAQRERDALAFCQAMGTLRNAVLRPGVEGPVWALTLSHPDTGGIAPLPPLLLPGAADGGEAGEEEDAA